MKEVKFTKYHMGYAYDAGDTAKLPVEDADLLIEAGYAEATDKPEKSKASDVGKQNADDKTKTEKR